MTPLGREDKFLALRIHINIIDDNRELHVYQHLKSSSLEQSDHGGKEHLRELYDSFQVQGPHDIHHVFYTTSPWNVY